MKQDEFNAGVWHLKELLLGALIRRLEDDEKGEARMAAAELSSCVNFLKQNSSDAPATAFDRVFDDEGE